MTAHAQLGLRQGAPVHVTQVKHERRGDDYPGRVVYRHGSHITVAATWTEDVEREHFTFRPGDRSIEHYWTDRWYSVWQVHAADGRLKGWYCNVARPAAVEEHSIVSVDLELDLWVPAAGGSPVRLDEDEFVASGLAQRDPAAADRAVQALDELDALASGPGSLTTLLEPRYGGVEDEPAAKSTWRAPHPAGAVIVARTITDNKLRWAGPAISVDDNDGGIAYFRPRPTTNKVTGGARVATSRSDRERAFRAELQAGTWTLVDHTTSPGPGSLVLARTGDPFAVWLRPGDDTDDFVPAYINIQTPHVRTPIGFDVDDLCLDITIDASLDWALKDADDLDERTALGIYSPDESEAIRAAAAKAIIRLETRQAPFDGSWRSWRPDPLWPTPRLPANWAADTDTDMDDTR